MEIIQEDYTPLFCKECQQEIPISLPHTYNQCLDCILGISKQKK